MFLVYWTNLVVEIRSTPLKRPNVEKIIMPFSDVCISKTKILGGCYAKWNKSDRYILWHDVNVEPKKCNKLVNMAKKRHTHRYRWQTSDYK